MAWMQPRWYRCGKWSTCGLCPYAEREFTLREAAKDKKFFLQEENKDLLLKRNNVHYYQCQGGVNILELPLIDFVVYTIDGAYTESMLHFGSALS